MKIIDEGHNLHWETNSFFQMEELQIDLYSWKLDGVSSSRSISPVRAKNIMSERKRRKKFNEKIYALRAAVPKYTKMDKASTIKDAIEYIEKLNEEVRRLEAEISQLESGNFNRDSGNEFDRENYPTDLNLRRKRIEASSIEVLDLSVNCVEERTLVIRMVCSKKSDTMIKVCEVLESMKLKIIKADLSAFSGMIHQTTFVEANKDEKDHLKDKIERVIAAWNDTKSPIMLTTSF